MLNEHNNEDCNRDWSDELAHVSSVQQLSRIHRDMAKAAASMDINSVRYAVDLFYQTQDMRMAVNSQIKAMERDAKARGGPSEPMDSYRFIYAGFQLQEENIGRMLEAFVVAQPEYAWFKQVIGIGPIIGAGLLAHIDITKAPTAGHIWRFAGLDPTQRWGKGEKRPWNAQLKTLCWKIGDQFVRQQRHGGVYAKAYLSRKHDEWERNLPGQLADQAKASAERKRRDDTVTMAWNRGDFEPELVRAELARVESDKAAGKKESAIKLDACKGPNGVPMLSPAHIDMRSRRYAVKLFLSHLHHVMYMNHYGKEPPLPYPIEHMGHAHYIAPQG